MLSEQPGDKELLKVFSFDSRLILTAFSVAFLLMEFFFFFFFFNFVTSPEGPLHNTIIFTTVLKMLFTISTVTRETNAIYIK